MLHDRQCRCCQIPSSHGFPLELTSKRITAPLPLEEGLERPWDQLERLPCPQEHLFYTRLKASLCFDRYKPRSMSLPLLSLDSVCKCALLLMLWSPKARFKIKQGYPWVRRSKNSPEEKEQSYSQEQQRNNTFQSDTPAGRRTSYYKACTKYFPVLLRATKLAQGTSQYYFVLQSLQQVLPATTLYYKACTKHIPVRLCKSKLAQSTSQYDFVLQSLHKVLPSTTSYYKAAQSTSEYYFVLESLHKVLPVTTSY